MPASRAETAQNYTSGPIDPSFSAASYRSAMQGETRVFAVTGTSKTIDVPAEWKNRYVNFYAEGTQVVYHVSTGLNASVDENAMSVETVGAGGRVTLGPHATNAECYPIQSGAERPIWFPQDARTFAVKGVGGTGKIRAHLAET